MPLVISDQSLAEAGLSPDDALREFACRLFDAGKLSLWAAARLARTDRVEFEAELLERGIAIHRPTVDDLREDLSVLDGLTK